MDRPPARQSPPYHSPQTRWFVLRLKDTGFGGPFTLEAMKGALESGALQWTDLAYVEDAVGVWKRLYELESLKPFLPPVPDPARLKKFSDRAAAPRPLAIVPAATSSEQSRWVELLSQAASRVPRAEWSSPRYWFLLLDGKEVGPVDLSHIEEVARRSPIPSSAYAWHVSMKRWKPFGDVPDLAKFVGKVVDRPSSPESSLVIERGTQRRRAARKSLVAAVFLVPSEGSEEMIGVCGDVSPEGFQLVQSEKSVDYITGTRLNLEIRASKMTTIPSFRVTAIVKWFDPEKKIVGFEFEQLDSENRKILENYTTSFR